MFFDEARVKTNVFLIVLRLTIFFFFYEIVLLFLVAA